MNNITSLLDYYIVANVKKAYKAYLHGELQDLKDREYLDQI
jgi:hypothetical protein